MVAKLSSVSTISAASLATSVPVMPMATPISACLRAGASLTPSPVMATTLPRACKASTRRSFCSGETRANTSVRTAASINSSSLSRANCSPVSTSACGLGIMPIWWAMARAVRAWSPVIIFTRIPACWHLRTASAVSRRGGSIMPCKPKKVSPWASPSRT